jgi:hypothetical protein
MKTLIQLTGAHAPSELADLQAELGLVDELRGRVTVQQPEAKPGDMGGIAQTLIVALSTQGAGTALAASISTWIRHRRPSADITITDQDGHSTKITMKDVPSETLDAVVRRAVER